jgi:hypothetical protein
MNDTPRPAPYGLGKHKLYRGLHLLWRLIGTQREAADRLGVSLATMARACAGEATQITLEQIKRAAHQYAREQESADNKYDWEAISYILKGIDPAATIAYTRSTKGDKLVNLVTDHVRMNQGIRGLSYTVWWFSSRYGYRKKHLRQIIKRALRKDPTLKYRQIEGGVDEIKDPINAHQVVVPDLQVLVDSDWQTPKTKKQHDKATRKGMRKVEENRVVMRTKKTSRGKSLTITTAGGEE